jgi:hypothetical protein
MKLMNKLSALAVVVLMGWASVANATTVTVDAQLNSIGGGLGLNSLVHLNANQTFTVAVDPASIWNFGGGDPSFDANADGYGLGWDLTLTNPDGSSFAAPTGALVGQIGTGTADIGNFFLIGTSFSGSANATGDLNLFFWDSDSWNNSGAVNADINAVPEPASLGLMAIGLLALARRRRA